MKRPRHWLEPLAGIGSPPGKRSSSIMIEYDNLRKESLLVIESVLEGGLSFTGRLNNEVQHGLYKSFDKVLLAPTLFELHTQE